MASSSLIRFRRGLRLLSGLHQSSPATAASFSAPIGGSISPSISLRESANLAVQSRSFKSSSISLLSFRPAQPNLPDDIGPDTVLFEGCDYNHWLFVIDFPKDNKPPPEEMIRVYEETCAKGLNISVEEAKKRMYACSTTTYTGFQAVCTEEESQKFEGLPGVIFVLPDSYIDPVNKEYGGDKYIEGTIIPRPPPVQYGRNRGTRDYNRGPGQYNRQENQMPNPQVNPSYNNLGPVPGDGRNNGQSQNYPPKQNYGPAPQQSYPPKQNYGPSPQQSYPPQQNYSPASQPSYPPKQNYGPASENYPPQQKFNQASPNFPPQQSYGPASPSYPPPKQNYGQASQSYPPQQNFNQAPQNYPPQQNFNQAPQNFNQAPQNYPPQQNFNQAPQNYPPPQQTYGPASPQYAQQQSFGAPAQQNFGRPGGPGQGERRDPVPNDGGKDIDSPHKYIKGFKPSYIKKYEQDEQGMGFKPSYMEEFEPAEQGMGFKPSYMKDFEEVEQKAREQLGFKPPSMF